MLARELTQLGERPRIEEGGVSWEGDARSIMRANLWLRTASRVVVRIARFRATEFFELERHAKKIPWGDYVAPGRPVEFRVTARKSKLYHSDAIAERLSKAAGAVGSAAESTGQLFVVRAVRDDFEISADTSGALLHMRGYRVDTAKAPLRETLAAALLLASGWSGDTPLVDPFCGSGTIPIEAALIACRVAPGIRRHFAFMDWPRHDDREWRRVRDAARSAQRPITVPILGSDRDAGAIEASLANAVRAGVGADVAFTKMAVSLVEPPPEVGLLCTNPPYGVRVSGGGGGDVRNLYAQLGNVLRARFGGWRAAAYAPSTALLRQTKLEYTELYRTSNGGIKVVAVSASVPGSTVGD